MGASPNWLSDYVGTLPADATAVSTPVPYAPTIGAQPARGTLPAPQPTTLADHLKAALNPVQWGRDARGDVQRAAQMLGYADPLDKVKGVALGAAALLPLIPGEGELSLLGREVNPIARVAPKVEAGLLEGFIPQGAATARAGALDAQAMARAHIANAPEAVQRLARPVVPVQPHAPPAGLMSDADNMQSLFSRQPPPVLPDNSAEAIAARLKARTPRAGNGLLPANTVLDSAVVNAAKIHMPDYTPKTVDIWAPGAGPTQPSVSSQVRALLDERIGGGSYSPKQIDAAQNVVDAYATYRTKASRANKAALDAAHAALKP
jgi:hypothetical protein